MQGITGFFSGLGSTIVGIFSSAANGARNAWNGVVGWFRGLPGTIGGFFSNAGSILVNAGASIINGFWDGLKGAWNNVTGWISGIGDWIKAHKGPISYDRRLLIPAGQAIMTGLRPGPQHRVRQQRRNRHRPRQPQTSGHATQPLRLRNTATPAVINTWNVEINGEVIDKDGTAKPSNGSWPTTTQGGHDAAVLHVHRHRQRQRLDAGERFHQGHRGPRLVRHRLGSDGIDEQPEPAVMSFTLRDRTGRLAGQALTLAGMKVIVQFSDQPRWQDLQPSMGCWRDLRIPIDSLHKTYSPDSPDSPDSPSETMFGGTVSTGGSIEPASDGGWLLKLSATSRMAVWKRLQSQDRQTWPRNGTARTG